MKVGKYSFGSTCVKQVLKDRVSKITSHKSDDLLVDTGVSRTQYLLNYGIIIAF